MIHGPEFQMFLLLMLTHQRGDVMYHLQLKVIRYRDERAQARAQDR